MVGRLVYLLDTNIILELLLNQEQADKVAQFFSQAPPARLYLSEFSLYSLGVILLRLKRHARGFCPSGGGFAAFGRLWFD